MVLNRRTNVKLGIFQKAVRTSAKQLLIDKSSQSFRQKLGTRNWKIIIKELNICWMLEWLKITKRFQVMKS